MLKIIIRIRLREWRNLLFRRLDRITRIEMVIALLVVLYLYFSSVADQSTQLKKSADQVGHWRYYNGWNITIWFFLALSGFLSGRKRFHPVRLPFLFTQPLAVPTIVGTILLEMWAPMFMVQLFLLLAG